MLIKQKELEGIRSGRITLAFRKWKKTSVRKGSVLLTSIGVIRITDITETDFAKITEEEAQQAGYANVQALVTELDKTINGVIYKIQLSHEKSDGATLRQDAQITVEELDELKDKLMKLDKFSNQGKWTVKVLQAIKENPQLPAAELAPKVNKEKEWLKTNVRKLKSLGLTISHEPGYTLTPLGEYVLEMLPVKASKA